MYRLEGICIVVVVVWTLKQGLIKEGFPKVRACHDAIAQAHGSLNFQISHSWEHPFREAMH